MVSTLYKTTGWGSCDDFVAWRTPHGAYRMIKSA